MSAPFAILASDLCAVTFASHRGTGSGGPGASTCETDRGSRTDEHAALCGTVALRCTVHTKMAFRNLKVFTEQLPFSEVK